MHAGHFIIRYGVVSGILAIITILAGIDVMPQWCLLQADRVMPVFSERNITPGIHRCEFFLTHIVVKPTTVTTNTTAQHQGHGPGAVHQVGVVPVIDAGTDDDHAFALGYVGGIGPFTRKL